MKTLQITSHIRRGSFQSQSTICEEEDGIRDAFEEVTVSHDSTDASNDSADIDKFMTTLAIERGAEYE